MRFQPFFQADQELDEKDEGSSLDLWKLIKKWKIEPSPVY